MQRDAMRRMQQEATNGCAAVTCIVSRYRSQCSPPGMHGRTRLLQPAAASCAAHLWGAPAQLAKTSLGELRGVGQHLRQLRLQRCSGLRPGSGLVIDLSRWRWCGLGNFHPHKDRAVQGVNLGAKLRGLHEAVKGGCWAREGMWRGPGNTRTIPPPFRPAGIVATPRNRLH